jgi:hypothetical protein
MEITITIDQAYDHALDVLRGGHVPTFISSPGIGKSATGRKIARKHNLKFIDLRLANMDPTDFNGYPFPDGDSKRADFLTMKTFPIEGDPLPVDENGKEMNGWLIMADEFNSCPKSVEAAWYQVCLDKQVGQSKLHKNVWIMMAGNKATDKAIVNKVSTATQSRVVWFEIRACDKAFLKYADRHNLDYRVKSFINFRPDAVHRFDPNHNEYTYACPRTWEFMSDIIKPMKEIKVEKLPLLAGIVGEGTGREFFAFTQVCNDIPTIAQVLNDPDNIKINPEPSIQYALAGLVGHHMNSTNADQLMKFVRRLNIEFQVNILKSAIKRDRKVVNVASVQTWVDRNSRELNKWK